ncbi:unnamed protein product [Parascedosporium putredinis]|uniref:adenosine deaminase n=1 Tax=Parascedosporium putredinis TaxID=1442378 RepID=A0A9P1MGF5_9PEZI|nr:unnamed protein product [Parascedosporium putredinis]CAI8004339.1 unnamed protein product [Parascedosporium putredinis]
MHVQGDVERAISSIHKLKAAWVLEEQERRHDHAFKSSLLPVERQAAGILRRLCRDIKIGDQITQENGNTSAFRTDMPFFEARELMEKSSLWPVLSKMPKGCLLHAHGDAMLDPEWIITQALEIPGYYASSPITLNPYDDETPAPIQFGYAPDSPSLKSQNIWSSAYIPHTPVPLTSIAAYHPSSVVGFKRWAKAQMSLTPRECRVFNEGQDAIWNKFASCFIVSNGLFYTEPVFRRCIREILRNLHANGIRYVELRLSISPNFHYLNMFECFNQELNAHMSSPMGRGFWGARIIWISLRSDPNDHILGEMRSCIDCKKRYPNLLAGFDLVGHEDKGRSLEELTPLCLWFQKQCEAGGLHIPFFFHAGECLGDGDSTDWNLASAVLLKSRRIGHAFSLYKHPVLLEKVKQNQILIESCPISNQILRLTPWPATHTLPGLLSHGVAVSINNDDPGVLGHGECGLTHDLFQVLASFDNVGLGGLADMVQNSILWAAFDDQNHEDWVRDINMNGRLSGTKSERVAVWRQECTAWCQWVVDNYS